MATYEQIEIKGQYYHSKGCNIRDKMNNNKRIKRLNKIFVIAKDDSNKKVLASFNGLPPEWFEKMRYSRWQLENPAKN